MKPAKRPGRSSVRTAARPPISAEDLRRVLAEVPAGRLGGSAEHARPVAFVELGLRLCRAIQEELTPTAPQEMGTTEYHFHLTHEDVGFTFAIGEWELTLDACQPEQARLSICRQGESVEEKLLPLEEISPERARSEMFGFASVALLEAGAQGKPPVVAWPSHRDPAMPALG